MSGLFKPIVQSRAVELGGKLIEPEGFYILSYPILDFLQMVTSILVPPPEVVTNYKRPHHQQSSAQAEGNSSQITTNVSATQQKSFNRPFNHHPSFRLISFSKGVRTLFLNPHHLLLVYFQHKFVSSYHLVENVDCQ